MLKSIIHLIIFLVSFKSSYAAPCHPQMNPHRPQLMIGYGSLISETSKKNTLPNVGPNIPVRVQGYARVWNMRAPEKKVTFLGVEEHASKSFNGVVFLLNKEQISAFDKREIGYCRKKVAIQNIHFLSQQKKINGDYWIYVPQKTCSQPYDKKHFPIANYYQQIFLSGCQEIEMKFHLKGYYQQCVKDMPIA